MANIKSRKKRVPISEKARPRSMAVESGLKIVTRAAREAVAAGGKTAVEAAYKAAAQKLDEATSTGVIHKNQATNRKPDLTVAINVL